MIKGRVIVNIYAPSIRSPKYIKQILRDLTSDRQQYSNTRGLQYLTFFNGQIIQTEKQ